MRQLQPYAVRGRNRKHCVGEIRRAKRRDNVRVKLHSDAAIQLRQGPLGGPGLAVRTRRRHSIERVGERHDPDLNGNQVSDQSVREPKPVEALVMRAYDLQRFGGIQIGRASCRERV